MIYSFHFKTKTEKKSDLKQDWSRTDAQMERKFLCFRSSWELDQTKKCYTSTYMWQEFQFAVVRIMIAGENPQHSQFS